MPESIDHISPTAAQLERALTLAKRAHDGTVHLSETEIKGLHWTCIDVLLPDMGDDVAPLHTFYMDPKGQLRG